MKKADHTRIPLETILFAIGLALGITVSAMGESRLVMAEGISQTEADARYVNVTGDTVTGNFAVDGNTTLGSGVEDYVSYKADYVEFLNPTTFDLAFGATFDGSGIPLVWKATQCDFLNAGPIIGADGSVSAPTFAFNDGEGNYDTGWWNSASKGNSLMHASVDATEVMSINLVTTTVKNSLDVDGSAVLGKGTSGNSIIFRGMDSWTSQVGPSSFTWNLDIPTTFDASGETWTMIADTATTTANLVDFTGSTNVTVPDANAPTEAMNRQTSDARYLLNSDVKSGTVAGASFAGNPKIYTVTFNTAFPDTNYSVAVISEESRSWTFQSKLAGSFVMNSNANLALTLNVDWIATAHNDP